MYKFSLIRSVVFVAFLLFSARAGAVHSMEYVLRSSSAIYTVRYLGEYADKVSYHLEVLSVVKGSRKEGIISVKASGGKPDVAPGTECVAFINAQNQWQWVGVSDNVYTRNIIVYGFGVNGHEDVYPAGASLGQMTAFIRDGKYSGTVEGNLRFFHPEKGSEGSDIYFAVKYTYHGGDSVSVSCLSGGFYPKAFSPTPAVTFFGDAVVLTYSDNELRPLEIVATLDSIRDDNSEFVSAFEIWAPAAMDRRQFEQYISNGSLGLPVYTVTIQTESGGSFQFVYGEVPGESGYLENNGEVYDCNHVECPTRSQAGHMRFGNWSKWGAEILLSPVRNDEEKYYGGDLILVLLRTGELQGVMTIGENGNMQSAGKCTLHITSTDFSHVQQGTH